MRKLILTLMLAGGVLAGTAVPALAGPPDLALPGCPGRSADNLDGPQATQPDNHPPATTTAGTPCLPPSGVTPGPG